MSAAQGDWRRRRAALDARDESRPTRARGAAPRWMVTFGDMMMLLLCFFVLLLSYATMDVHKFQMLLKSIKVGFGRMSSTAVVFPVEPNFGDAEHVRSRTDETDIYLAMRLEELIDQRDLSSVVEMTHEEAGVLIRVRGDVLFERASVSLSSDATSFLDDVADLLLSFPHFVLVRGHTDPSLPDPGGRYPSNWELSSARASSVARHMIGGGRLAPTRFAVMGSADTRPLVDGHREHDHERNRRVELFLVNQSTQAKEGVSLF